MATEKERRQQVLTEADLEAIRSTIKCETCAFTHEEADALRNIANKDVADTLGNLAKNINTATKLSTKIIITGVVLGVFSGVWFAIKQMLLNILATGKLPK